MTKLFLLAIAVCFSSTAFAQPAVSLDPAIVDLLKKMSEKPRQINYEGIFTYQHKDNPSLQTFRVIHWHEGDMTYDRLQHLNGPERELSRRGAVHDCESIGDKLRQGKMTAIGDVVSQMQDYHFELRSKERIAGRIATVLLAVPKDPFRYSYFFSIDDETGLILKVWLVDEKAHVMERYQFTALNLKPDLTQMSEVSRAVIHKSLPPKSNCVAQQQPENWQLAWVPNGFTFAGEGKPRNNLEMLMFTDGLATFSIFIEPAVDTIPEGVAQRGATLAMMTGLKYSNQLFRITVVGEIPAVTAQRIVQGITHRE
ncbi:MAG: MucB/RseB C-terminal domain-containing protein [Cellvibrio sp.]|nr:MucB/RseB C-terminal domain-containing protein [Cellvibrio sp.]